MGEILIGAVAAFVVLAVIGHFMGDEDEKTVAVDGLPSGELKVRIREVTEKNEETGYVYPAFEVQVKGSVPVPHDQCPVEFRVHLFDGPEADLKPVLCSWEEMRERETQAFEWRSDSMPMPFHNGLDDWTTMLSIPKEVLVFPARGERRVSFQFCVIAPGNPPQFQYGFTDGETGMIYAIAQTVSSYDNPEEGYEDGDDNRRIAMHTSVALGLLVGAVEGKVGQDELGVIKQWMQAAVEAIREDAQKEEKELFRTAVNDAHRRIIKGDLEVAEVVQRMNEHANTQEKYTAIELCIDVMAADGKADPKEMAQLDRIARMLRLDPKTYREMTEQRLAKVADVGAVAGNLNTMLGITPDMSPEDVKNHLTAEYRKWNSRVSHPDEQIRKRAQEMLLMIGEARAKFVD